MENSSFEQRNLGDKSNVPVSVDVQNGCQSPVFDDSSNSTITLSDFGGVNYYIDEQEADPQNEFPENEINNCVSPANNSLHSFLNTPENSDDESKKIVNAPPIKKKLKLCHRPTKSPKRLIYSVVNECNTTSKKNNGSLNDFTRNMSVSKTVDKRPSVKRKRRNVLAETTRDRLLAWIDMYSSTDYGIWIQCCECQKWRLVNEYEESYQVPDIWKCSMNKDKTKNNCEAPEECEDVEFTVAEYVPGSLVWAKMTSYPWWPAMVEDDPDTEDYYWVDQRTNRVTDYHVTFLDKKVTRAWIPAHQLRRFLRREKLPKLQGKNQLLLPLLQSAQQRAVDALNLSLPDRLRHYSFAHRYRGKWPYAEDEANSLETTLNETQKLIQEVDDLDSLHSSDLDSPENTQLVSIFKQSSQDLSMSNYGNFENILKESMDNAAVFTSSQSSQVKATKENKTQANKGKQNVSKNVNSLQNSSEKTHKKVRGCTTKDTTKTSIVKKKCLPNITNNPFQNTAKSLKERDDHGAASEISSLKHYKEINSTSATQTVYNCSAEMQDAKEKKNMAKMSEMAKDVNMPEMLKSPATKSKEKIPKGKRKLANEKKSGTESNDVQKKKKKLSKISLGKSSLKEPEAAVRNVVQNSENSDLISSNVVQNRGNEQCISTEGKETDKDCSTSNSLTRVVAEILEPKIDKKETEDTMTSSEIIGNSQLEEKQPFNEGKATSIYCQDTSDEDKENKNTANFIVKPAKKDKKSKDKLQKDHVGTKANKINKFNLPLKQKKENSDDTVVSKNKESAKGGMKMKKVKKPFAEIKAISATEGSTYLKINEITTVEKPTSSEIEMMTGTQENSANSKIQISSMDKPGKTKARSKLESEKKNDAIKLASKVKAKRFHPPVANGVNSGSKLMDEVKDNLINPVKRCDDDDSLIHPVKGFDDDSLINPIKKHDNNLIQPVKICDDDGLIQPVKICDDGDGLINPIKRCDDDNEVVNGALGTEVTAECPQEPEYVELEALANHFVVNVPNGNFNDDEDSDPFDYE